MDSDAGGPAPFPVNSGASRVRIKVCGITRAEDAATAVSLGVDALGFIFAVQSPRHVAPEEARRIISELPPFVSPVGVFVDARRHDVEEIIRYCHLAFVQLHGEETPKYCERLLRHASPCRVVKAFRVHPDLTREHVLDYAPNVAAFLFDTWRRGVAGGTGEVFDWSRISGWRLPRPTVLAGGLTPDNVAESLQRVRPFAVDVNSGVEVSPGIKDERLLRDFVGQVRRVEREVAEG